MERLDVSYRPATANDLDGLFELQRATMREVVERVFGPWDDEAQRARFEQSYDPTKMRVVRTGDEDVGMVMIEDGPDELYIGRLQIAPDHQNRGLGGAVVADVIAEAAEQGKTVALTVFSVNPAQRLYRRLGFIDVSEAEGRIFMRHRPR